DVHACRTAHDMGTTKKVGIVLAAIIDTGHAVARPVGTHLEVELHVLEPQVIVNLNPALPNAELRHVFFPGSVRELKALDGQRTADGAVADAEKHFSPIVTVVTCRLPAAILVVGNDWKMQDGLL